LQPAGAQRAGDASPGGGQAVRIVIVEFVASGADDQAIARGITQVIGSELGSSGAFAPIDAGHPADKDLSGGKGSAYPAPQWAAWRAVGAQAVVAGRLTRQADRVSIECRLWDVAAGHHLMGQMYQATPDRWREVAYVIADGVHEHLTGRKRR
jgi:TolB protein